MYNPKNKLQQAFVITLGRAGEDNRSFRLTDIDSTLAGFAGADYDMLVRVLVQTAMYVAMSLHVGPVGRLAFMNHAMHWIGVPCNPVVRLPDAVMVLLWPLEPSGGAVHCRWRRPLAPCGLPLVCRFTFHNPSCCPPCAFHFIRMRRPMHLSLHRSQPHLSCAFHSIRTR